MVGNLVLITVLLFHAILHTHSDVINEDLPEVVSDCVEDDRKSQCNCIYAKLNNPDWIESKDEIMNLRLRQKFYWHPIKRIRRECRAIPREEWKELMDAINALKQDKSHFPNVYDYFADLHTNIAIRSVHKGPNFFGWHRYYILKFEELLRKINPNVTLCYWDSRLDHMMPFPPASIMFTEVFMGNMHGPINKGPFAGWKTIRDKPLHRHMGRHGSKLITPISIEKILSRKHHSQITTPTAKRGTDVELIHSYVHAFIGGQMGILNTSSQDPFFWIHHSFIDSVWDKFCQQIRKNGIDPQDDYSIIDDKFHSPNRKMDHLKPLRNIDGYSHYFTKHIYEYQEFAECSDCLGSPLLKCVKKKKKCRSIERYEPRRKVPVMPKRIATNHLSKPLEDITVLTESESVKKWVFVPMKLVFKNAIDKPVRDMNITGCEYLDNNTHLCSSSVAIVQSNGMTYNGAYRNYIVNDVSIPQWTYVYVGVKNPTYGPSQSFISVTDKTGGPCVPYCLSENDEHYHVCTGVISVTTKLPKIYLKTVDDVRTSGFVFDPLEVDTLDKRIKLTFHCY